MNFVIFCQSLASCWNHGNAHFLRGVARELIAAGHRVAVYEPADGWSRNNLLRDHGEAAIGDGARVVPRAAIHTYALATLDLDAALDHADVVLVHEWNDPALIARLGEKRLAGGTFTLLFHDTHHCAVSAPDRLDEFQLDGYDGVLAFGEVLREIYLHRGWGRRVYTWHEAADTALFRPNPLVAKDTDLIWIGNWGDGERDAELREFLVEPSSRLGLTTRIHGVRYPGPLVSELHAHGIHYGGWLANHRVPDAFARARVTVHVPRRPYVQTLTGIPTIRMFEALACGIPLVSAPWDDAEALFPPGSYVKAKTGDAMAAALSLLLRDAGFASDVSRIGLDAIRARHTCRHRIEQLLDIVDGLGATGFPEHEAEREAEEVTLQ